MAFHSSAFTLFSSKSLWGPSVLTVKTLPHLEVLCPLFLSKLECFICFLIPLNIFRTPEIHRNPILILFFYWIFPNVFFLNLIFCLFTCFLIHLRVFWSLFYFRLAPLFSWVIFYSKIILRFAFTIRSSTASYVPYSKLLLIVRWYWSLN